MSDPVAKRPSPKEFLAQLLAPPSPSVQPSGRSSTLSSQATVGSARGATADSTASGGDTKRAPEVPNEQRAARVATAPPRGATAVPGATLTTCPHCNERLAWPELALVCVHCYRFVLPLRLWHSAAIVALILGSIVLQATWGHSLAPAVIGLLAAQALLAVFVRSLNRWHFALSILVIPASISLVAAVLGVSGDLAEPFRKSLAWVLGLGLVVLSIELFRQWLEAASSLGISRWTALGSFSVAASGLALAFGAAIASLPLALVPSEHGSWEMVRRYAELRSGLVILWVFYSVMLAAPSAFARPLPVSIPHGTYLLVAWALRMGKVAQAVALNLGRELEERAREMVRLARHAVPPVGRRLVFVASAIALQVGLCLATDWYLEYMVSRRTAPLLALSALLLTAFAPMTLFWSVIRGSRDDVVNMAGTTVSVGGMVLILWASFASWPWWAYEIWAARGRGPNLIGLTSLVLVVIVVSISSRKRGNT